MVLRKISPNELTEILRLHKLWLRRNHSFGKRANLRSVDLQHLDLEAVDLQHADLEDSNLQYADLRDARLLKANLRNADLHEANLRKANLYGVDLSGADLQGTSLEGATLSGADFRNSKLDQPIPRSCCIRDSKWLSSDIPWWLGHPEQSEIVLCDE